MSNPYRKYDGMSYRDITWRLRYKHIPEVMIDETIAAIKEYRRGVATDKARKRVRDKAWGELLAALQHERRIVRSMVRYTTKSPAPERAEFAQDYFDALTKVYEKLTSERALSSELPKHSHWTDYVPQRIKDAFVQAACAIPHRQKAKFKEPFTRTDPIVLATLRHGRLMRKTRKDLDAVKQRLTVNPDDVQAQDKAKMLATAVQRIRDMEINAHVPNHWADVVPDLLRSAEDE